LSFPRKAVDPVKDVDGASSWPPGADRPRAGFWYGDTWPTTLLLAYCRLLPRFRGKGTLFQTVAALLFRGRLRVRNCHGVRLTIQPSDYIGRTIAFDGGFELDSIGLAERIMRSGGVFVDVGCHFGLYTLALGALPGVKCIAIDGSFAALARLQRNLQYNPTIQAQIVSCALSSENGIYCLEVAVDGNLGSTRVATGDVEASPGRFWVAGVTLQEVLCRLAPGKIKLLKLDVEGFELSVLKGLDFRGPFRPENLIVECYEELFPWASESFDFLVAQGYEALSIDGMPLADCHRVPEQNVWFRMPGCQHAERDRGLGERTA
jgi:FkbM family methyltransferase